MIKSQESRDFEMAVKLQNEIEYFGLTENAVLPKNKDTEKYKPRTLIDQTLELIDPTPNIYTLFVQFNKRFFWNILLPVEVKWSSRMTSCAGVCTFHPRNRQCVIALSLPLLKLRPRKDLVETLLHEMIHGYLFLTNNNRDRDGHGPEFCKHMNRINKEAGTKITIYHSFHDEVKLYQQHWWRCNGPCQKRAPYFGTVRRAMNRAPGPSDFWWKEHQKTCNGQFIKIKEPENYKTKAPKPNKKAEKPVLKSDNMANNMFKWLGKTASPISGTELNFILKNTKPLLNGKSSINEFKKSGNSNNNTQNHKSFKSPSNNQPSLDGFKKVETNVSKIHTPNRFESTSNNQNFLNTFKKLGNNTNNVHGWGTGGPNSPNNLQRPSTATIHSSPKFSSSEVLGGSYSGQSNLLSKFDSINIRKPSTLAKKNIISWTNKMKTQNMATNNKTLLESNLKLVECPICSNFVADSDINKHVNLCLLKTDEKTMTTKEEITSKVSSDLPKSQENDNFSFIQKRKVNTTTFSTKKAKLDNFEHLKKAICPVCSKSFQLAEINVHLDKCLSEIDEHDNNSTVTLSDLNYKDERNNESIISISSNSSSGSDCSISDDSNKFNSTSQELLKNNKTEVSSHKCLICNTLISPEISLNDHLEDCIGSVFNDDSILLDSESGEVTKKSSEISFDQNNKYPCPVCMQLIPEPFMNQHLDNCLSCT